MGHALATAFAPARHLLEEVDDALGQHLSRLMFEGPDSELMLTENAQPAIMAASMAAVRVLREEGGVDLAQAASFVAGHSLGEYTALCAAGSLSVADTARLLKIRGRAMQEAVPVGEGAMAAILGLNLDAAAAVSETAADDDVCATANDNAPGQVVVSGHRAAVERAINLASEAGAKRCILLPVSAPFHCALMAPAAEVMREALAKADLETPVPPLVANVTASAIEDPDLIRELLVEQVTSRVRWRETVLYMVENGVDTQIELGAGRVLTGLAKRICRDLNTHSVREPSEVEVLLNSI
jgi:[acyl-carrier-protein] S-malonyltransferase